MAILGATTNTTLSTANGFVVSHASNMGVFNATTISMIGTRQIPITFSATGNLKWVVLCLRPGTGYSMTVDFQEFVASVWTTRISRTLTSAEIGNSTVLTTTALAVPFVFSSSYAYTTAVSTWRLNISVTGAGTFPQLVTSNGTEAFYATFSETTATFADNDTIICGRGDIGTVTIDQTATLVGVLGTGDALQSVALIACRSTDVTNQDCLIWGTGGSYTLTLKGWALFSLYGGLRAGTSGSPITIANRGKIRVENASVGTASNTGLRGLMQLSLIIQEGASINIFGQLPTDRYAYLSGAHTSGASFITVDRDVSAGAIKPWLNGDVIYVGYRDALTTTVTKYTISSISGTQINITGTLAANYLAGGFVFRTNFTDYGFEIENATSTTFLSTGLTFYPHYWNIKGCALRSIGWTARTATASNIYLEDLTRRSMPTTDSNYMFFPNSSSFFLQSLFTKFSGGAVIDNNILETGGLLNSGTILSSVYPFFVRGNYQMPTLAGSAVIQNINYYENNIFDNCYFTNGGNGGYNTTGGSFKGNVFHRGGGSGTMIWGIASIVNLQDTVGNVFRSLPVPITISSLAVNSLIKDSVWVSVGASDINPSTGSFFINFGFSNATGSPTFSIANQSNWAPSSTFSFEDYNNVAGDNRVYKTEGIIFSTGFGLADTTALKANNTWGVAASGERSVEFSPSKPLSLLIYQDNNGSSLIGNSQNLDCSVSIYIKINNAAFYGGVHTKPTLRVTYDNTTVVTNVASGTTAGQILQVSFTPATTVPKITVQLEMETDATGTNRDVYVGKVVIRNGSGVVIDTQKLDAFDDYGIPLASSRTLPTADNVWNAVSVNNDFAGTMGRSLNDSTNSKVWGYQTSNVEFTNTGTAGRLLNKALSVLKFLGLK